MFRAHGRLLLLLELLVASTPHTTIETPSGAESRLWWEIETRVRRDLRHPMDLRQLETWSGFSAATIARAAQSAVGEPPMRRVKRIRLTFARGLVLRSRMNFSEIADRIGYPRVHEFSRDYKRWFGATPTEERRQA